MCVSMVAVRLGLVVIPSPQSTDRLESGLRLLMVKLTVTTAPVFAGWGVMLLMVTVGGRRLPCTAILKVIDWVEDPLVPVTVIEWFPMVTEKPAVMVNTLDAAPWAGRLTGVVENVVDMPAGADVVRLTIS